MTRRTDVHSLRVTRKRAVPNRPAWSKPPLPRQLGETTVESRTPRGLGGLPQAWCYMCGSAHFFHESCTGTRPRPPKAIDEFTKDCIVCGMPFHPSSFARTHHVYCTDRCKVRAKLERRREAYAKNKETA